MSGYKVKKITVAHLPCVAAVGMSLHVYMTAYVFHFVFTPLSSVVVQSRPIVINIMSLFV